MKKFLSKLKTIAADRQRLLLLATFAGTIAFPATMPEQAVEVVHTLSSVVDAFVAASTN